MWILFSGNSIEEILKGDCVSGLTGLVRLNRICPAYPDTQWIDSQVNNWQKRKLFKNIMRPN